MLGENLHFAFPWAFLLLLLVPLMLLQTFRQPRRSPALRFSAAAVLFAQRGVFARAWWLPGFLRAIAFAFLVGALARPQIPETHARDVSVEGIDIVLTLDLSTSMEAVDFGKNRVQTAKEVLSDFIARRPDDRIGLVVFAGEAYTQSPLTLDHNVLTNILKDVRTRVIEDGTAIGNALATATNRLRDSDAKSKVIVLITDGDNNAGQISPLEAAQIATQLNVKVFTILVGKSGLVKFPAGKDFFGNDVYQDVEVDVNPELLQQIAKMTHGSYSQATNRETLQKGLNDILNTLDKSQILESGGYTHMNEEYGIFLLPGLLLLFLELLLSSSRLRSFP
jgi:Ca-activated chloride channel family protein